MVIIICSPLQALSVLVSSSKAAIPFGTEHFILSKISLWLPKILKHSFPTSGRVFKFHNPDLYKSYASLKGLLACQNTPGSVRKQWVCSTVACHFICSTRSDCSKVTIYCVFLQKTLWVPTMLLSGVSNIAQKWTSWWLEAGIKQLNCGIPELPVMQEPSLSPKRYVLVVC